jgi:uncharacterized membrane protein YtjA (UPF0391 family)
VDFLQNSLAQFMRVEIQDGLVIYKEIVMLRAAIAFFVLGLVAILLGANGIGGLSVDIGKTLLFIFLILAVISFIASLVVGKRIVK